MKLKMRFLKRIRGVRMAKDKELTLIGKAVWQPHLGELLVAKKVDTGQTELDLDKYALLKIDSSKILKCFAGKKVKLTLEVLE